MRLAMLVLSFGLIFSLSCQQPQYGEGYDEAVFSQFSTAPESIPNIRSVSWAHEMGTYDENAEGLLAGKARGAGPPTVLIDNGICPESDEPCSFTLVYASSQRIQDEVVREWVIRWILRSEAASAEGISRAWRNEAGEPLGYQHFKRAGDEWVAIEEGSDEYETLQQLSSAVVYMVRYIKATQQ